MIWKLAWRNVWRRRRRTVLTSLSVATALWVTLLFTGMANHNWSSLVDNSVRMGLGHITVEPAGYLESPTPGKRLNNVETRLSRIGKGDGVERAIARVMVEGMVASAVKSVGAGIIGIDPAREEVKYNFFFKALSRGRIFGPGEAGVVVGKDLAERLNLKPGKKLVYTCTDKSGEIVSDMARVTGIFSTGIEGLDGGVILLPIANLRRTLHYAEDEATLIAVFLNDQRRTPEIRLRLERDIGGAGAEVWPWQKTQPEVAGSIALDRSGHLLFQFFIALLAAAGILDTILMSVLERKHEFGVMMAVGYSPKSLFGLVLVESAFVGMLGLAAGALLNAPFYLFLSRHGFDLTILMPEGYNVSSVPLDPVMRVLFYPEHVLTIIGALFALTLLAGLYPAWKASRVPPVESIRLR